jgi:hypothetical protein
MDDRTLVLVVRVWKNEHGLLVRLLIPTASAQQPVTWVTNSAAEAGERVRKLLQDLDAAEPGNKTDR